LPATTSLIREVRRFIEASRPDDDSDRSLIARFVQSRDERAFAEVVRRYGPMVLGVCRRVLRHATDAEDALQATFLILVRRAADLRDPDRLGPWLYGVALRTATKLRTSRRPNMPLPDELAQPTSNTDWPVELDEAIGRLPEKYRTPIILCHLQGLSTAEVAERIGCPPATIVTRLFRARATLRRRLTALGITVPAALVGGSVLQIPLASASAIAEMAAGRTISPAAALLADGVFRSILMTKIRWAATTVAAFSLLGVGVLGFQLGGQEPGIPRFSENTPPLVPKQITPPVVAENSEPPGQSVVTTANFRVIAPSARVAKLIADVAENSRKDVAVRWLGKELPNWQKPCPIRVSIGNGSGGATTFNFLNDKSVPGMEMQVEGELDRLLADTVPHEVTHCVLADHFRSQLPRWVDEGVSLLSETEDEQKKNLGLARSGARTADLMQMRALFESKEYPSRNIGAFFAQSLAVTKMLVERKDRPTLIAFVKDGMKDGWEPALKKHYGYADLSELENDFLRSLSNARKLEAATNLGPLPILSMASADADGRVTIFVPIPGYSPVTTIVKREKVETKDGKEIRTSYYEPVTRFLLRAHSPTPWIFAKGEVKSVTAAGMEIDEATMLKRLKDGPKSVVLMASGDERVQPFREILKDDTLILVVPLVKQMTVPPQPVR